MRIAVLYQAAPLPGYQDSGADVAYNLSRAPGIDVVTTHSRPAPRDQTQWCFPDAETRILAALDGGATHLWANTIVFRTYPLQISSKLGHRGDEVKIIGQPPCLVELYDDKRYVDDWLRSAGKFTMPQSLDAEPHSVF